MITCIGEGSSIDTLSFSAVNPGIRKPNSMKLYRTTARPSFSLVLSGVSTSILDRQYRQYPIAVTPRNSWCAAACAVMVRCLQPHLKLVQSVLFCNMDAKADPSNPVLVDLIEELESSDADVYREAAEFLGKVNRDRPEVNLSDLDRNTEEGDTVVVPGKLLGSGTLGHELEIAAFKASRSARQAADEVGSFVHIEDLVEERPDGEGVEIVV